MATEIRRLSLPPSPAVRIYIPTGNTVIPTPKGYCDGDVILRSANGQAFIYGSALNMFGLGVNELVLILVIVLVLFGASRIPQLMKGIGTGVKEFRHSLQDDESTSPESSDTSSEKKPENPEQ